jgi:diacylglycerol kinase (ATP)
MGDGVHTTAQFREYATMSGSDKPERESWDGLRGWRRLHRASRDSLRGLTEAWRAEEAFRIELLLLLPALVLAFFLGENGTERALLAASVLLVLIVELLNSAIEAAVDRIGREHHALSGYAKRLGSAAVLLSLLVVVVVWLAILV